MYWRTNLFAQEPLRQPLVDRSRRGDIAGLRVRASRVRPHVPDLPLSPHLQSVVRRHGQVRVCKGRIILRPKILDLMK